MCLLWRSPITRSPEFTSGDFIFNPVIADSGMLEIGTRQLNNWRLHEPPDFLPFCQPGALSTRLYCSWMPRHHFQLPGRYNLHHLRHGHGTFCSNWHNRTGTRTSHLSHEKTTNEASGNKTFTSETIDPAIIRSKTLKLQRTSKNATTTARR